MNKLRLVLFILLSSSLFSVAVAQNEVPRTLAGGILNGKAVSLPKPVYPADAKAAGIEGTVYVKVVIDESGNVESAVASTETQKVTRRTGENTAEVEVPPADPLLRDAAEKAALEAKFSPTLLSGQPVKVSGTVVYNFVASKPADEVPVDINGGILNEKANSLPQPTYPDAARAVRACGTVNVRVGIDENGDVVSASAVSGHPLLRSAAVKAAREAKFSPTLMEGKPVKVSGILTYSFAISEDGQCSQ
jgi:TonB family protein